MDQAVNDRAALVEYLRELKAQGSPDGQDPPTGPVWINSRLLQEVIALLEREDSYHLNTTRDVAVGEHYFMSMDTCPLGVKVQLESPFGVAVYGTVSQRTRGDWRGWYPVPRRRDK